MQTYGRSTHPMQDVISSQCPSHIILFTKYPTPGFAKTRLIPAKGPEGAAQISNQLTQRTLTTLRSYQSRDSNAQVIIHYAAKDETSALEVEKWLKPTERQVVITQEGGDLGDRLIAAFERSFAHGASKVVVVGSDAPGLNESILMDAFAFLDEADVVIGPAEDGGYYLLGLKVLYKNLFTSIPWSTSAVLRTTVAAAESLGLSVETLPTLRDIDTPDDLNKFFIS